MADVGNGVSKNDDCCAFCGKFQDEEMVQCDICDEWSHFNCVNVTEHIASLPWSCMKCEAASKSKATVKIPCATPTTTRQGKSPMGKRLDMAVGKVSGEPSCKGSGKSRRSLKIELTLLEERKKIELEYLDKKHELLRRFEDSDVSDEGTDDNLNEELAQRTLAWASGVRNNTNGVRPEISENIQPQDANVLTAQQKSSRQVIRCDLPTFSGRPEEWPLFISSFENSTTLCGFSHAENLLRLQKALKGRAFDCVNSKLMIPSLVPEIISTLRSVFGRPEHIINHMVNKIRTTSNVNSNKLESIVSFALDVKNLVATMEATGLQSHLNNPMLLQELIEKLPAPMRLDWARHLRAIGSADLRNFGNWIFEMGEAATSVSSLSMFGNSHECEKRKPHRVGFHQTEIGSALRSSEKKASKSLACYFCGNQHMLVKCEEFKKLSYSDKWSKVQDLKLCNGCLKRHDSKYCKERRECQVAGCTKKHHPLLHKPDDLETEVQEPQTMAVQYQETSDMLYKILPVTIHGHDTSCDIFAFLDDGSGPTLIEKKVLDELGIQGVKKDLCLKWTDGTTRIEEHSDMFNAKVSSRGNKQKIFFLQDVRSVKHLNLPAQTLNYSELCEKYNHLKGLPVESYRDVVPQMIIGLNNKYVAMPLRYREGKSVEPAAAKTRLGWTVYGETTKSVRTDRKNLQLHICQCDDDVALQRLVADSIIKDTEHENHENDKLMKQQQRDELKNYIKQKEDHFVVKLLWKTEHTILPDNYLIALHRLKCFEKKLNKEPNLKDHVNDHIKAMIAKGYVRKLCANEIVAAHPRKWYLPIFTVRNPNKPEKVRIVWDAAAQCNGVSLNTCLERGPDLLTSLVKVLWNFRTGKIGVCGDICEMFHRVSVQEDDQHSQRFLWRNCEDRAPDVYVLKVLSFGASCSPALAQYVKNENALRFKSEYPRATKSIISRHYVDDMLDSVDSVEEAIQLAKDVRTIHSKGNFHIRNWLSNSLEVVRALGEAGEPQSFCSAGKRIDQVLEPDKVLGLWWDTSNDTLTFNLKFTKTSQEILRGKKLPTKRQLLRMLMSIFDPLGLLSFYLIDMRILFQKIWRSGIDWDDMIPEEYAETWNRWLTFLPEIENINIPRYYFGELATLSSTIQLHVFVDASENAYAAAAYLRVEKDGGVYVSLVGAKARVAPLRPISIPRMELMAAVMGAQLGNSIKQSLDVTIEEVKFWTDSKTVLFWLRSDPRKYKQFVMYRIGEIQEITDSQQWNYVPTKLNVADQATKLSTKYNIETNNEWFYGPAFLRKPVQDWPEKLMKTPKEEDCEIRKGELIAVQSQTTTLIDWNRFSKLERLLKCIAYVNRFINATRAKIDATKEVIVCTEDENLTSEELDWSLKILCRLAQGETFQNEIRALYENKDLPKFSILRKCSPFIDKESVLRLRSRLQNASFVGNETKNPIILPKDHYLTKLIIDWYHRKYRHQNYETVINEIFQIYYIPSLRRLCRTARDNCQVCKVRRACPQPPEMGSLPEARLSPFFRPFTHVGVDFFGPFFTTVGRRTEKRYGVLFSCLTCRAIHIEMAYSLSMSSCCSAIRNFMARRGTPQTFFSDNGTNLTAAEKELRKSLENVNFKDMKAEFTTQQTTWNFIPPASPHMGGAWERMVRSVKTVLYQIVTPATKLTDEKLHNLLLEVESIVNSRPLTYLSLDTAEEEALTPNHFLLGSSSGNKPPGEFDDTDKFLRDSWRHSQYLANRFWKRWVAEVLPTLTRRTTWFHRVKPIEEGDVVIIVDPNSPRFCWPKGIVERVFSGKDGQTRSVIVRTQHGRYHRPAAKIAVLDIRKRSSKVAENL